MKSSEESVAKLKRIRVALTDQEYKALTEEAAKDRRTLDGQAGFYINSCLPNQKMIAPRSDTLRSEGALPGRRSQDTLGGASLELPASVISPTPETLSIKKESIP